MNDTGVRGTMPKTDLLLMILGVALLFVGIFDHSLWAPHEPAAAEISRAMAATGDYLIPHLAGRPVLSQPPLYYAVTGLFWKTLGTANEGFGRLSSVLFALATLMVVFSGVKALFSVRAAVLAMLITGSTIGFFMYSHKIVADNALAFFVTGGLFSFILAHEGLLRRGYPLFWLCLAGAFLTGGFRGIAVPCACVTAFVLWQRDPGVVRRAWVPQGMLIVGASVLAWAYVLYLRGGLAYLSALFPFIGTAAPAEIAAFGGAHVRPFHYFLQILFTEGLPWSLCLVPALGFMKRPDPKVRFFLCWLMGGLIVLSAMATKRGLHLLPVYPAMAVIVGTWLGHMEGDTPRAQRWWLLGVLGAFTALAALTVPVVFILKMRTAWPMAAMASVLSAGILGLTVRSRVLKLPERLTAAWLLLVLIWSPVLIARIESIKNYEIFFTFAGKAVGKERVIGHALSESALAFCPFYGGFTAESVDDRERFEEMAASGEAAFALYYKGLDGSREQQFLRSRGSRVIRSVGYEKRPTELWCIRKPQTGKGATE